MKNYYEILEVNSKASREIIESTYKILQKKYNPASYKGEKKYAENKIKDINEAYRVLSDQFLREQYDKEMQRELEKERLNNYNFIRKESQNLSKNKDKEKIKDKNRSKNNNKEEKEIKPKKTKDEEVKNNEEKKYQVGSIGNLIFILKGIFKSRPNIKEFKKPEREDLIAAGLTLIIVLVLGLVLWFIPATNTWLRKFFMPLS